MNRATPVRHHPRTDSTGEHKEPSDPLIRRFAQHLLAVAGSINRVLVADTTRSRRTAPVRYVVRAEVIRLDGQLRRHAIGVGRSAVRYWARSAPVFKRALFPRLPTRAVDNKRFRPSMTFTARGPQSFDVARTACRR